ncbi:MAG: TonB family protein [Gemmatimonadaceae bacterium]|nr:TonB family protein [Gemmatimonadaceae bacterium]
MLNTLLESRAARTRRTSGSLASLGVHGLIIGTLVVATAKGAMPVEDEPREVTVQMTELPKPAPMPPTPSSAATPVFSASPPALGAPALSVVIDIPTSIPPIDLSRPVTNAEDFATGRRGVSSAEGGVPGGTGTVPAAGYFFEGQVEKPAMSLPGQSGPAYPDALRSAGMEGQVLAQFVVDSSGRAQLTSFTALHSDHPLFTASVKSTLARLRFLPAEVGNRRVPQLVQQTFQFTLNRE